MAKQQHAYLPATLDAVQALGAQVAAARRELGWTAAELAGRLGVTPALVSRIEKGAPGTAIGTVLEAAVVCGVPLFGVDATDLGMSPTGRARAWPCCRSGSTPAGRRSTMPSETGTPVFVWVWLPGAGEPVAHPYTEYDAA